jgi:hypothetical protein
MGFMMTKKLWLFWFFCFWSPWASAENPSPEKSACFAFVDRDFIFTLEIVEPGVPILNFVSMAAKDWNLLAKNVRLKLETRTEVARVLAIEAGDFQQAIDRISLTMRPRSSFGVRIDGDFGPVKELFGVTIRLADEDFELAPLNSQDFEIFVQKVNRLNLRSPDFSEDLRVLRLQPLGTRSLKHKGVGTDR